MQHIQNSFPSFDGLTLYSQAWQPDEEQQTKAILIIVHGFGEHSGRYNYLVDALVPQGYAIHALDLRGHGRSEGQRGSIHSWDEFRGDVRTFVQKTQVAYPNIPYFIMGHSMGGLITLDYILREPEGFRGVIASSPYLSAAKISPIMVLAARILLRIRPNLSVNMGVNGATISRDLSEVERYQTDPLVHAYGTPRLGAEIEKMQASTLSDAVKLSLPLLIYHGAEDALVPIEGSRAFYEQVTFSDKSWYEYEGGYHELHNDIDRDKVLGNLKIWLDQHI